MTLSLVIPILRQILQVIGGALIAKGVLDAGSSEALIGAALNLTTFGWWLFDRNAHNSPANKK
jgi:hypothetical protein